MPSTAPPILQIEALDHRAMGSESLRVEILSLFVIEAERLLAQAESADSAAVRAERLNALAGAARQIGAVRLAETARHAAIHVGPEPVDLQPLRVVVADTLLAVRRAGA